MDTMAATTYSLKLGPLQRSIVEVDILGSIYADPEHDPAQTAMADAILDHFVRTKELLVKLEYAQLLWQELVDVGNEHDRQNDRKMREATFGLANKILDRLNRPAHARVT